MDVHDTYPTWQINTLCAEVAPPVEELLQAAGKARYDKTHECRDDMRRQWHAHTERFVVPSWADPVEAHSCLSSVHS